MPPIEAKLSALRQLLEIYDGFLSGFALACRRHCAHCCTADVVLTSLEGYFLLENATAGQRSWIGETIASAGLPRGFQPLATTNQIAALCMQNRPLPGETAPPLSSGCALLEQAQCPIYPLRPFACRCMVSHSGCSGRGHAEMDPLILTLNTVGLQVLEHIDQEGFSGNLCDVLAYLLPDQNRERYAAGSLKTRPHPLVANRPIPALLVPPEHREPLAPLFSRLNRLLAGVV